MKSSYFESEMKRADHLILKFLYDHDIIEESKEDSFIIFILEFMFSFCSNYVFILPLWKN